MCNTTIKERLFFVFACSNHVCDHTFHAVYSNTVRITSTEFRFSTTIRNNFPNVISRITFKAVRDMYAVSCEPHLLYN